MVKMAKQRDKQMWHHQSEGVKRGEKGGEKVHIDPLLRPAEDLNIIFKLWVQFRVKFHPENNDMLSSLLTNTI